MMLSVGLMSGTSMDGIDAALLATDGSPNMLQALGHCAIQYDDHFKILLKAAEFATRKKLGDLEAAAYYYEAAIQDYLTQEIHPVNQTITIADLTAYFHDCVVKHSSSAITLEQVILYSTRLHAKVVKQLLSNTGFQSSEIDVIGFHGQTLFHRPAMRVSVAAGNAQYLANELNIPVVHDFRREDVLAGGQGAPFAPLYHHALAIKDKKIPLAVINCGGIANITFIDSEDESALIAFDTGPGNGLIDQLVRQRTHGKENMDRDGRYGLQGKVHDKTLQLLYEKSIIKENKNYFTLPFPKSLDIGDLTLIPELALLSLNNACRTLEVFTADSIVTSLITLYKQQFNLPQTIVVAGGGWNNPVILNELRDRVHQKLSRSIKIVSAHEFGWHSQAMEAQVFAYLAVRSLQKKPLSFPSITGVPKPLSGGTVYFPASYSEIN